MGDVVVGLLHPGEMGSALGSVLQAQGAAVLWASAGRGTATVARAGAAGIEDAGTASELARRSDMIISVCPPHAARDVARAVAGFTGVFVDANAVSPDTARAIASLVEAGGATFVDGGIVGPPPLQPGMTRLYLSGPATALVAGLFADSAIEPRVVSDRIGDASAVKMAYAAWTKGTTALLLAVRALARSEGVEQALLGEWRDSQPQLPGRSSAAARSACAKGWRWIGEMDEIASTFASAGLPAGFHQGAAEVFRRLPRLETVDPDNETLERVLAALAES
jgi:3-hydroxyisobutyrate dehydrogenase-like beta-hydroxyacid dehydrogenase